MRRSIIAVPLVGALAFTGCSGTTATTKADNATFVATTTVLGSVTKEITDCAGGTTTTLMPVGTDPHDFELSSSQGATIAKAKLVIVNGLGLEQKLTKSLESAKKDGAKVLEVAPKIDPIPFVEVGGHDEHEKEASGESATPGATASGHDDDHKSQSATPGATASAQADEKGKEEHGHGQLDPHFWLDPMYMAKAVTVIGNEMATVTGSDKYRSCATTVSDKLKQLGTETKARFDKIPAEKRVLITDHEAFGYFAKAYGFRIIGVAVPGGTTDAKPSAAHIAELAKTVKENKVPVIFSNAATNPSVVQQIAREAGTNVSVVPLLVESVGEGDKATYEGMFRFDVDTIAKALGA